ncbi:hypothetical protein OOZ51_22300 [Arthrobacter sp. MI7-26]|nr:hypothetical protein [Arthrobacter sp. MI7-26]
MAFLIGSFSRAQGVTAEQTQSLDQVVSSHQEVDSGLDVSTALAGNTPQKSVPKPLTPSEQQEANRIVAGAQAR